MLPADGPPAAAITGVVAWPTVTFWAGAASWAPRPLASGVAAISVGVVDGSVRLDLPYEEDSRAEVDANVVGTDAGELIEVQSTGEGTTFSRTELDAMLDSALTGIRELSALQAEALARPYPGR